jgi:DnaD/phage-associated family protein
MDLPESRNGFPEIEEPIPDINPDINKEEGEEEAGWQEVVKCYQNNIHPIFGSIDMEKLSSLYKDFGKDWVMSAIEECMKSNVRNLNYLSRILERWGRDGYKVDNRHSKANEAPRELSFEEQVAQMEAARQKRMALEEEYLRRMEEAERNGKSAGNGEYTSGERTA